jgi:hypothetical protein
MHACLTVRDADEVIAFGFYDTDLARERENPRLSSRAPTASTK